MQVYGTTNTASAYGTAGATANSGKDELGKDAFLQLLVTQLQNQDPLNPTDNTEFVAQLAQFSSLEGITNLNTSMTGMSESIASMEDMNTSSLIGHYVKASASEFEYAGSPVVFGYNLKDSAQSVSIGIYDEKGMLVKKIDAGAQKGGDYEIGWDGTDNSGVPVRNGVYTFSVSAINADNSRVEAAPYVIGPVLSVNVSEDAGIQVGGTKVDKNDIIEIF